PKRGRADHESWSGREDSNRHFPTTRPGRRCSRSAQFWCLHGPAGVATLPGARDRPLAQAEHVAGWVLEPGSSGRTERGDEVDGLRRLVLLERHTARAKIADDGLDVINLEVHDRLTTGRGLPTPDRQLRALTGAEPKARRALFEE